MKSSLLTALAVIALANCDNDADLLAAGNVQFTSKMLTEVAKSNPGKSIVLSAFSVLTPLAQLLLASEGKSHDELLTTIGLPSDQSTISAFSQMNTKFQRTKGVDLKMANKIYVAKGYTLLKDYEAVLRQTFQSDVKSVDFTDNKRTAEEINNWVEDQTNHRIKDLVDSNNLDADTRAVLVNAVYFKGTWKYPFNKLTTRQTDFHVTRDKVVKMPTMYKNEDYYYGENAELDAKILKIPYVDEKSALYIILPNDVEGITTLIDKLKDPSLLNKAVRNIHERNVDIFIPKFKIETTTNLKQVLSEIGVKGIFNPVEANLTKLTTEPSGLYVSDAVQKAFIEINEEGTEAAAANEFSIALYSDISTPVTFKADHPFVYLLETQQTITFEGIFYS